ncbi:hypothetical protein [Microvirga arsenatis]|uniref:Uncharacterized protein n=1 Tax=Microvirga arsenatis TaxID=2692265 RepID=A0ABW9Z603_9HYPH|nr:hypothetical protein [Microvirga arsenatis]NBJ13671.1 hypothetical protein [Microvirga arsenatis]NBJ27130.1 hypothetical protein [Microvirga arsenatis]
MEMVETKPDANNPAAVSRLASPGVSERSFVEALIDPVNIFASPQEVVEHPWFSDEEKRTILLSWARDELVIEQVAGRVMPDLQVKSRINAVIEALALFDPSAAGEYLSAVQAIRGNRKRAACRTLPH